jgi:hypothetical protein
VHNSVAYINIDAYPAFCIRQGKSFVQKRICISAKRTEASQEGTPRCEEGRYTNTFRAKTSLIDEIPCQAKKQRSETLKQDSIVVSSRSVRICSV